MASALRPFTTSTLALALLIGALAPAACKAQGEGERCDKAKTKDADCEPPLVCISDDRLLEKTADRCCPATSGEETDPRCRRAISSSGTGGNAGAPASGDAGASTGEAGASAGTAGAATGGIGGTDAGGAGASGGVPASEGGTGGTPDAGEAGATASLAGQGGTP